MFIVTDSLWSGLVVVAPSWQRASAFAAAPPGQFVQWLRSGTTPSLCWLENMILAVHGCCVVIVSGEVPHGAQHGAVGHSEQRDKVGALECQLVGKT